MNPLGSGGSGVSPQILENIRQIKGIMGLSGNNPMEILQRMNNPMANQVLQMLQTQNPQQVFMSMTRQIGVDPNAIIRELRS